MKTRIPFSYEAEILTKRSSKVKLASFVETLEFELPEISPKDAPIALTVGPRVGALSKEYRHHEGVFLQCVNTAGGLRFTPEDLAPTQGVFGPRQQVLVSYLTRGQHAAIVDPVKEWYSNPNCEADQKPHPSQVSEILSSGKPTSFGNASRFSQGMVLIDGIVWFPVPEPRSHSSIRQGPAP